MSGGTVPDRTCHQNLVVSLDRFLNQNDGAIKELIKKSFNDLPEGMLVSFSHFMKQLAHSKVDNK